MNISTKIAKTYSKVLTLAIIALFASSALRAQVAVAPLQLVRQQFLSGTGVPLAGGCLQFFATGTSTPQAIYADSTGTSQLANPLTLDAAGEASVWMSNTGYDIVANTGVNNTACSVSLGTQLWRENNKNPFSIINGGSNYIVASGTVDPSGSFGMLAARSDIPCLRFFTTIWDCVVELTLNQTLTNKSMTLDANTIACASNVAGQYARNNGTKLVCANISQSDVTISIPNNGTFGTLLNSLAKISGATGTVQFTNITDTGGVIGIVIAGNGLSGNATIQSTGLVNCAFDGATTSGDYVQISTTQTGGCKDVGAAYPTSGQVIGRVLSTNGVAGTYQLYLFGPEIKPIVPVSILGVNLTAQAANISTTPIVTPSVNGFYRASCYIVLTQAGTVSSTLPNCAFSFTDPDANIAHTVNMGINGTGNTIGLDSNGNANAAQPSGMFYAKTGVAINYATAGYASSGATPMQYAIHIRLEGPF